MASLKRGKTMLSEVQTAMKSGDYDAAMTALDEFKVHAAMEFGKADADAKTRGEELRQTREAAERGVMISASARDEGGFERHAAQAKAAYDECERHETAIERSSEEALIVGLNLLRLLVQNRIAEFHTELETTNEAVLGDARVQAVLELERFLMEGAYNKIAARQSALPDPSYEYFMSMLMDTVRDEIASCAESAYASLTAADATKILGFSNVNEYKAYAESREWNIDAAGNVVFNEESAPASAKDIPAMQLINNSLLYAKELERIV